MTVAIRYFTKSKKGNTKKLADCVSKATGIQAETVETDLSEKVDRLILINAMYAANIDGEVKEFLARNRDKIGVVVNMNTSASGKSTFDIVKKATDALNIPLDSREFHCAASWIFINKGLPTDEDFARAAAFAKEIVAE